jgi:hypothetical protein
LCDVQRDGIGSGSFGVMNWLILMIAATAAAGNWASRFMRDEYQMFERSL